MTKIIAALKSGIFNIIVKKDNSINVHVGEIPGTYDYFINFKRKHPTYQNFESDYLTK